MAMMKYLTGIFFLINCVILALGQYRIPTPKLEALHPKGFRVSIPDNGGIKLFAFHGQLNEPIEGLDAGMWSRDILSPTNGRWTFIDKYARLKHGDIIYYWIHVIDEANVGHNKLGGVWEVSEFINDNGSSGYSGRYSPPSSGNKYKGLSPVTIHD